MSDYVGVIDIGNSGIKVGVWNATRATLLECVHTCYWKSNQETQKQPPAEFTNETQQWASMSDVAVLSSMLDRVRKFVYSYDCSTDNQSFVWNVSSVQPNALATLRASIRCSGKSDLIRVITREDIPIANQVTAPDKVGIDRLIAAWAGIQSANKQAPLIVVQAGTAVTVDWVDASLNYCGGAILPGISLTLKYLALGTAHLPWLAPPRVLNEFELPGRNTEEAILAGVSAGFIGGVQYLIDRYRKDYSPSRTLTGNDIPMKIPVVLSGGDGISLAPLIEQPVIVVDHLVLQGLGKLSTLLKT